MEHQWYWKNWWKLWPYYTEIYEEDYGLYLCFFCFGPYQCRWYKVA